MFGSKKKKIEENIEETVNETDIEAAEDMVEETVEETADEQEYEAYEELDDVEEFEDFEEEDAEDKHFFLSTSDVFHIVRTLAFIVFVVSVVYSVAHPNILSATLIMFFCILFILTLVMQEKK
ncbi:MAG: hypothetical protein IKR27_00080 [Lachnospiraceae bacterium]|nr:hypothetical protein [Lachnospiraceae bacterium]